MWHLIWNNLLYVYTNGYNEYHKHVPPKSYDWGEASVWVYIILAGVAGFFIAGVVYMCWDMVSDAYWRFMNRNKIKSVTVRIHGRDMTQYKLDKMTEDVNAIIAGDRLPEILRTHKLSAVNIVSMSTVPQPDCFIFTVWYK